MYKLISRILAYVTLFALLGAALVTGALAQTPLAPGSIQVSRVQYDGDTGNTYVSPYSFPEIFNDQAGLTTGNDIQNVEGIQGSIYIDQFNSVPASAVAGTLSLPSTGAPASYPTVEPGTYITTSFSSKSEGALMLSLDGTALTYMGYQAGDQLDDVSNSYSQNPNYQLSPNTYTYGPLPGIPYPFYDREVALIQAGPTVTLTPIDNTNSGDNPRAALTVDENEFYIVGNSDSTTASPSNGPNNPGLTIGARCGAPLNNLSYQLGTYLAADRKDESAKKHVKDNNWRGVGIYTDGYGNQQLVVSKGSGGNGDDGLFQVGTSLPACSSSLIDSFGINYNAGNTIAELPGLAFPVTNQTTGAATPILPFGFWFANPTTLYIADEGYPPSYSGGSSPSFQNSTNGTYVPSNDPLAGLEKWSLVNGTWTLDYTIQAGLNFNQPQTFTGYNDINGDPIQSYTYGIRNITGTNNGDGTVTIYAITAQFSAASGGESDPTSLVGITDSLAATTLPTNEQFATLQISASGEVYRGVAYVPSTTARQTQTISFPNPGPVAYGVAPITLAATSPSGWPIAYTLISGPATLSGNVLTITGAGSVVVQADQSGNTDYAAATSVQDTIVVNPEATTVSWSNPLPITYGTPLTTAQLNATASVAGTFAYLPAAGATLTAGLQTLTVTFTPSSSNYAPSTASVTLQVNQATPTIAWSNPVAITYGTPLSGTQLNATANVAGTFAYLPAAGAVLGAGSQTLSVTFTPTDSVDYTTASASVTLQVNQAKPAISWSNPLPITYGTPLSGTQLNATANTTGTFAYLPAATTVLGAGSQTLSVTFTPADTTDYTSATASVTLQVNQATQTITFTTSAPATAVYGTSFKVAAVSTLGLPVTYTSAGACTNSGATYTMTSGSATCTVTASEVASANYLAASPVSQYTAGTRATPTVSFTGAPATEPMNGSFTLIATTNASGSAVITVNKPAICSLSGSYSPVTVTILASSGSCTFKATWGADPNYTPATATQVTKAVQIPSVITWATPAAITYGTPLSATQLDASDNVAGVFTYSPASGTVENAGNDTLQVTFVPTNTNYQTETATVTLQVLKAASAISITSAASQVVYIDKAGIATAPQTVAVTPPSSPVSAGTVTLTASTGETCTGPVSSTTGDGGCTLSFSQAGTSTVTATYAGDSNHNGSSSSNQVSVTVNPYPAITWSDPATITYGTALSATQLNATANVQGTFTYSPGSGTVENAGVDTLKAKFVPNDPNEPTVTASVTLQVLKATSTTKITSAPTQVVYLNGSGVATALVNVEVTAYEPTGTVTLTASTGETCTGSVAPATGGAGCNLQFSNTGTRTVTASYAGDKNHTGSNSSNQVTVTVDPH